MNVITPEWPAPESIHAHTTLCTSWGFPGKDIKSRAERDKLVSLLSLPSNPIWLNQIHGNTALPALPENIDAKADASFTDQTNQVCLIITADCIPVLICDKQGKHVAAAHAGWRGLAGGVIENTINAMGIPPEDLLVWLGPAIGPEKFEVGEDVRAAFIEKDEQAKQYFKPHATDKWLANLHGLATLRLGKLGVNQVFSSPYCTHSQQDMFFSYRRDGAKTGRMATVIWIGK